MATAYWLRPDVVARTRGDRAALVTDLRRAAGAAADQTAAVLMLRAAEEIEALDDQLWQAIGLSPNQSCDATRGVDR